MSPPLAIVDSQQPNGGGPVVILVLPIKETDATSRWNTVKVN